MAENEENAIIVENVYKNFNVFYDKTNTIKEKVLFWNKSKKEVRKILKGIDLTIKKGEVVGLIGVNGSGKEIYIRENVCDIFEMNYSQENGEKYKHIIENVKKYVEKMLED